MSAEIIVNPTEKTITINDESLEKDKSSVTYPIESIDCNYNNSLRDGYAFYRTWSQGTNEEKKEKVFKIETDEEGITITFIDETVETIIIKIDTSEVVKE